MDSQIGNVLRKARDRRKVDLSEVEDATKIRLGFLRAIENEEWDALPGGVYTRAFIRTYASFLGLDGERLAEDYRSDIEGRGGDDAPVVDQSPAVPPSPAQRPRRRVAVPRAGWLAVAAVVAVAVIAIVALPGGGSGGGGAAGGPGHPHGPGTGRQRPAKQVAPGGGVSVRLAASAEVWVCMLDAGGRHLVNGQILEAGAEEGPFRSGSFTVSFGNGEVSMLIDGKQAEIPATSSPIGYAIDSSGELTELSEAERPTCA
jgi:Helix-turn-helix domain